MFYKASLFDIIMPIIVFPSIVLIVYFLVSRYHATRVEMIRQGINPLKYGIRVPGQGMVVWGIIFLSLGIGGIVGIIVKGAPNFLSIVFSVASVLGGIGFISYWKVSAADRERALRMKERMLSDSDLNFGSNTKSPNQGSTPTGD